MNKFKTIDSFFKRKEENVDSEPRGQPIVSDINTDVVLEPPTKFRRVENDITDIASLVREPGLRPQIWEYPVNKRDEIRRAYIHFGPYHHIQSNYPYSTRESHPRRFQAHWFRTFPWLEYSPTKDAVFCFPCYLFAKESNGKPGLGSDVFIVKGFKNWKKVNGKDCAFLSHMGKDINSVHNSAVKYCENLKNQSSHIEKVIQRQSSSQISNNRLRLKASIDVVRWLTFQACAFRGNDESADSINQGNFLEMLKLLASYNEQVHEVVLDNAPQNAKYTSHTIQKDILSILARNVQNSICKEIGEAMFCLIVDEARDESKREQMGLVIRFVDKEGFVRERFLDLIHVKDTTSLTLKEEISYTLSHHNLNVLNIRGQGYDGASNMRGEWNGLQALILKVCPYAYYVHCFAHQLQLALVASSREVSDIHCFFHNLSFIVNIVGSSSKRNDELQAAQVAENARLIECGEIDTGRGANQMRTLQRPGDTRWGSHFNSICSLIRMFASTCVVLQNIAIDGSTFSQRGDATFAVKVLMSFDFAFILHVMKEIMGITNVLCQVLQQKSQDILNAMHMVSSTKSLLQKLRDAGWETLIENVTSFCSRQNIQVPDMNVSYSDILRSRRQKDIITVEHHYRVDIFTAAIDQQLQELNNRFNEQATELLTLSTALNPRDGYKSFASNSICKLAEKFYPSDFSKQEMIHLNYQLQHYELDVPNHPELKDLTSLSDLCRGLVKTEKSKTYPLVDRLIRLILTLPVSTATTERAFSAMKVIKTRLRNRMEDDFLKDSMIVYIEKEIAKDVLVDTIIDEFYTMKERRAQLY